MSTIVRLAPAFLAALLLAAAPASAAPRAVPPGHSGASQYTETLPTAGGEQPTAEIHGGAAGGGGAGGTGGGGTSGTSRGGESTAAGAPAPDPAESLGAKNAKRLERLGAEGKAAARLAAAGGAAAGANDSGLPAATRGSSPVKQVVGELTGTSDSGGMGLLLPLLIAMTVLVAAAAFFARRRPLDPHD